jgi:hypothetical protein
MLYEAVSHPKPDKLEVTKTSTSSSGSRNALDSRKYYTIRQGFDYIDLPFYSLLGRFGDLIPETKLRPSHELRYRGEYPWRSSYGAISLLQYSSSFNGTKY